MVAKQSQQTNTNAENEAKSDKLHEKGLNTREVKAQIIQKQQESKIKNKQPPQDIKKSQQTGAVTQSFIVKGKNLIPRGIKLVGVVVSDKMDKTVVVKTQTVKYYQKYQMQDLRTHRIKARNPEEIGATEGDTVEIQECRKISKYTNFIVTKILSHGAQK